MNASALPVRKTPLPVNALTKRVNTGILVSPKQKSKDMKVVKKKQTNKKQKQKTKKLGRLKVQINHLKKVFC